MSIAVGDKLPDATFMEMTDNGPEPRSTADVFSGKTVALFAVPGAYTPTCSAKHLPGFVEKQGDLSAKGVDEIVVLLLQSALDHTTKKCAMFRRHFHMIENSNRQTDNL